jgi:hypothetical protein
MERERVNSGVGFLLASLLFGAYVVDAGRRVSAEKEKSTSSASDESRACSKSRQLRRKIEEESLWI